MKNVLQRPNEWSEEQFNEMNEFMLKTAKEALDNLQAGKYDNWVVKANNGREITFPMAVGYLAVQLMNGHTTTITPVNKEK